LLSLAKLREAFMAQQFSRIRRKNRRETDPREASHPRGVTSWVTKYFGYIEATLA